MKDNNPMQKAAVKGFQVCLICAAVLLIGSAVPLLGYLTGAFQSRKALAVGLILLIVGTVLLITGFFGFVTLLGLGKRQPPAGEDEKNDL